MDRRSNYLGDTYAIIAELSQSYLYNTPIKVDEGILDWKDISWIHHPNNLGIADVKYYLPIMLNGSINYEYKFTYTLLGFTTAPLQQL